jgi:hypothetical protein
VQGRDERSLHVWRDPSHPCLPQIVHEIQNVFDGTVIWGEDQIRSVPRSATRFIHKLSIRAPV